MMRAMLAATRTSLTSTEQHCQGRLCTVKELLMLPSGNKVMLRLG